MNKGESAWEESSIILKPWLLYMMNSRLKMKRFILEWYDGSISGIKNEWFAGPVDKSDLTISPVYDIYVAS